MCKCANVLMCKWANVLMGKCANVQMCKCAVEVNLLFYRKNRVEVYELLNYFFKPYSRN